MEKIGMTCCLILLLGAGFAQPNEKSISEGRYVRAQLSFAISTGLEGHTYFPLHGTGEVMLGNRISVAGDAYCFWGSEKSEFRYQHSFFLGPNFNFPRSNNVLYFGLQPGVLVARLDEEKIMRSSQMGVNPLVSFTIGDNFFVNNWFHFFIQSRFVVGAHHHDNFKRTDEFRVTAGLGFNFMRR